MKKIGVVAAALLSVGVLGSASVQAREFGEIYTECGLGALIFPKHEVLAAITNVTWDLGTTAISSNVSSPDTCSGGKGKKVAFIHDSVYELQADIARGKGQHLSALMDISGCAADSRPAITEALRSDLASDLAAREGQSASRMDQAKSLFDSVTRQTDGVFAKSCTAA